MNSLAFEKLQLYYVLFEMYYEVIIEGSSEHLIG